MPSDAAHSIAPPSLRMKIATLAPLAAILLVGAFVRVWQLPNESPWWDEIVCLRSLDAPSVVSFVQDVRRDDPALTPVYFSAAYWWAHAVSPSVSSMRLLSVAFGLLTAPLIFALTRALYGVAAGLIAALALAVSMVHVYFSQEVRVYSLATCLAVLSIYGLLMAERGSRRYLAIHFAANALLAFTHLFGTFLFVAEGLWVLGAFRDRRRMLFAWIGAHVLLGVALLGWLSTLDPETLRHCLGWMVTPGWRELAMTLVVFAGGRPSNEDPSAHLPTGVSLDLLMALLVYGAIGWFLIRRFRERAKVPLDNALFLLLLWFAAPPATAVIASFVWRPCFVYRYVLYSAPALYILFGAAVAKMPSRTARYLVLVIFAAVAGHQLLAVAQGPFRADWRAAGAYIGERLQPRDRVIVFLCVNRPSLEYNAQLPPEKVSSVEVWSAAEGAIREALRGAGAVWFVDWLWTEPGKFDTMFHENHWSTGAEDFAGWPNIRVYRIEVDKRANRGG